MERGRLNIDKLKVAAFDWDNTLTFSRPALIESVNVVLKKYNLPEWEEVKNLRKPDLSFRDNFPYIFGDNAYEAYEYYREVYKEKVGDILSAPSKGTATLRYLKTKGIDVVIVTNKDRMLLEYELPMIYDTFLFTRIVCGHEAIKDKPSGEQLRYAVDGLVDEITPENVWMIGDSPMDSRCALDCGAKAIRIGEPIWEREIEKTDENILFFSDFTEFYHSLTE